MDGAKFITVNNIKCSDYGTADFQMIVFPDVIAHNHMVRNLGIAKEDVVSAGFISVGSDGSVGAYGKSVSLGLAAREDDNYLVNKLFQTQAYWDQVYGD